MNGFWRTAAAAVCALALIAGCSNSSKDEPEQSKSSQTVGAEGKNLKFPEGVEVAVPQNAVTSESHLEVTKPMTSPTAVLGATRPTVRFDVSLTQNGNSSIQPLQPLTTTVDLRGAWVPDGAKPQDAKVYTPIGNSLWLVPSKIEGTKLTMSLGHLSPKYITYVSDADLVKSFDAARVKKDTGSCAQQIAVDGGKVKFGSASKGWSTKPDSHILACLYKGNAGEVRVGILNRVDYVLSIAGHADVRFGESTGDAETEMIKAITRQLFPNDKVKALVGDGGTAVGSVKIDDLPSTIEIKASHSTFAADSIMRLLGLTIGALTGKMAIVDNLETIGKLLKNIDVITCFQGVIKDAGADMSMGEIASIGSKCIVPIMEALGELFDLGNLWARATFVVEALKGIYDTIKSAWNGIRVTIGDTISVPVVAEMEAKFTHSLRFAGLNLPLYSNWATKAEATDVPSAYDMSTCHDLQEDHWKLCAGLSIQADMVYSSPEEYRNWMQQLCPVDAPTTTSIGGERAYRFVVNHCDAWEVSYQMHLWFIPNRDVVISYTIPERGKEMKGVDKALAAATWS